MNYAKSYTEEQRKYYNKGYYAGYRKATIDHLGGQCEVCGSKRGLQIDHNPPIFRKARTLKDLSCLSKVRLLCKKHNIDIRRYK